MTLAELRERAKLPPPNEEQHPGPPPGWVPPPPPKEMEPECEAAISGAVCADGREVHLSDVEYVSQKDNESALYARGGAVVSAENVVFEKRGGALVREIRDGNGDVAATLPMLRGINSTVLANGSGTAVHLRSCRISSPCTPGDMALEAANGVFAVFHGKAFLEHTELSLNGGFGHGLYDSQFGTIYASDCTIRTAGHCASAIATDQPGGDLYITGTDAVCTGPASAGVYVDGGSRAELYDCSLESAQGEGAVLCSDGNLLLSGCTVRGTIAAKIWQPIERPGTMTLTDCTLVSTSDSAFVFDGGFGTAVLERCTLLPALGQCAVESRRCPQHYDHIGNGTVELRSCTVSGDIGASDDCSLAVTLKHTLLRGQMHNVHLTVGFGSHVTFTGDSFLAGLKAEDLSALSSSGPCTVTYVPAEDGITGTHLLSGGGKLIPQEDIL